VELADIDAVQVLADRDGLRVILENLLDNAHKYGGGTVRLAGVSARWRWRLDISDRAVASRPKAPRSCSTSTTAEAAKASRMARAWDWRLLASSLAAWVETLPRAARAGAGRGVQRVAVSGAGHSWPARGRRMVDRIAIVEDERLVRELVAVNLRHAGYDIVAAENFEQGKQLLAGRDFQLAILDVMLPGGDGFALTRFARDQGINAPILMLTARSDTTSKVRGLDAGADDYLPKPFDVNELLARVRALLRRSSGRPASAPPRLAFASYWVRFDTGQALTNEGEVSLSDKELRLMEVFSANENRALTRTDLLEEVWGMDQFPTDRTVDNFILRLRKLFEPDPENPVHIVTLRGRGYLFRSAS
jgi:DNA-binding response OmpR family regulator